MIAPPDTVLEQRVAAVRRFSRFYTRRIGVLQEGPLKGPFSLAELRVLYEIAHRQAPTASELARDLGLDAGYLSRILRSFEAQGFLAKTPSETDGRQHHLALTAAGRDAFAPLDRRSHDEVAGMLAALSGDRQARLVGAMAAIEDLLGSEPAGKPPYLLRPHREGDMGWVTGRHGALYCAEYGWNIEFEALVAEIVAQFIRSFDPRRECCLIAEVAGEPAGSVFVVRQSDEVAKLRLLLVEPSARGLGIGARLVNECLRFARAAGYSRMTLWTQSILTAARRIYQGAGFRLTDSQPHRSFGHDLIGETWDKDL